MQALPSGRVVRGVADGQRKRAGAPIDPWWVLQALRRGWRLIASATLGGLALGVVAMLAMPQTWESEAVVVPDVEVDPTNPFAARDALHEGGQLIDHPLVLTAVRARLGIEGSVEELGERIDATVVRDASIIRVTARSTSPTGASGLAQVVVDTFLAQRRASETARLDEHVRLRRNELTAAEGHLSEARVEYDAFRATQGISDIDEERVRAIEEVARLNAEADAAAVVTVTSEVRMRVLRAEARRMPEMQLSGATRINVLRRQLAEARVELARARARYTPDHPAVASLEARIAGLEGEMSRPGRESVTVESSSATNPVRHLLEGEVAIANADRATAAEQQVGLRRLAEQARERVRELSAIEGQASLLLAAVRVGEAQVDSIRRDIAQSEDRRGDPRAGFHIAAAPTIPDHAMPSRGRKLMVALPPLLAFLIAFGFAFFRERGGPSARTAAEVAWWGNAPVIGTTMWPRVPEALDLLVGELEDMGIYAAGRTLVVPAMPEDRQLAAELALRLASAPWLAAGVIDVDEAPASERPAAIDVQDVRVPGHRLTLPMPPIVTPAPQSDAEESRSTTSSRVRRASVRLVVDGEDVRGGEGGRDPIDEGRPTLVGHDALGEEARPRRNTGRFTFSAPTLLVGPDVRVGNIVRVGGDDSSAAASVLTSVPSDAEKRTVHVSGTIDVEGASRPFEVHAEAPRKENAVLMLAMRILGDGPGAMPEPELTHTVLDLRAPRHRPADPSESRAPKEQAVALAWTGSLEGPTLRRAARLADRVLVVVREGAVSPSELARLQVRLGREDAIGLLVIGVDDEQANRVDRVGAVAEFWTARRRLPG